jgi:hypothetical protein
LLAAPVRSHSKVPIPQDFCTRKRQVMKLVQTVLRPGQRLLYLTKFCKSYLCYSPSKPYIHASMSQTTKMPTSVAQIIFMDFPPEIRNRIYLLVLKYKVIMRRPPIGSTDESLILRHTGMLSSCQQINREASPVFYAVNAFQINSYPGFTTQPLQPRDLSHTRNLTIIDWCPRMSTMSVNKCLRTFWSTLRVMPRLESLEIYFDTRPKHRDSRILDIPVSLDRQCVAMTLLLQYARVLVAATGSLPEGFSAVAFVANRAPETGRFETAFRFPISWIKDL